MLETAAKPKDPAVMPTARQMSRRDRLHWLLNNCRDDVRWVVQELLAEDKELNATLKQIHGRLAALEGRKQ